MQKDLSQKKGTSYFLDKRIYIMYVAILPKLIYKFNMIPPQNYQ